MKNFFRIPKLVVKALPASLLFFSAVSNAGALRYEEIPELVKKRNGAVDAASQKVEASRLRTGHFTRSLLPHLDVLGGAEHFKTGPYPKDTQPYGGAEVFVNVFRGGQDSLEERARTSDLTAAEAEKDKNQRDEIAKVRSLYWDLVYERELLTVLNDMSKKNKEGAKAASKRQSRGIISGTDLLAFDITGQQLKEQSESSIHEIELLGIAMRPRIDWPETDKIETIAVIPHDHDDSLVSAKWEEGTHPETKMLLARADSSDAQATQQARWWLPTVDIYGSYQLYTLRERFYPNLSDRFDWAVGVRLRMHLFEGMQQTREAQSGYRSAQALETLAGYHKRTLASDVRLAQEEMKHIHELIHGAEATIEKGKKLLNQSLSEYDRGVRTTSDILAMNDRVLSLQKSYLERRRDYQKTKVKLLSLVGQ